jgi:acyl-CoA thioesterase-2
MDVRDFIGLVPTEDPRRWSLAVTESSLTPAGAMQGGAVFAAAVEAMEGATGRPLVWAAGQCLSHLGYPAVAAVSVEATVTGHHTTQARVAITHDDIEVLVAIGALGERPFPHTSTWGTAPTAPPPRECPPREVPGAAGGIAVCEVRAAVGRSAGEVDGAPGAGRSASWVRLPGGANRRTTAGDLAIIGDFVMLEVTDALGVPVTGSSLDNTLRVVDRATTEWVLVDATVHAVSNGFCPVTAQLWSEDGALLGVASQTLVLRELKPTGALPDRTRRITGGTAG